MVVGDGCRCLLSVVVSVVGDGCCAVVVDVVVDVEIDGDHPYCLILSRHPYSAAQRP